MLSATRRWLKRNRTPVAVGLGVLGAGYIAAQYVTSKINDARERLSSERVSKENLRRRFEQNQEDCTFTVLALLPTATQNIIDAMNTENITYQIQRVKGTSRAGSTATLSTAGPPSLADTAITEDDGRSTYSESGIHVSQIVLPSQLTAPAIPATVPEDQVESTDVPVEAEAPAAEGNGQTEALTATKEAKTEESSKNDGPDSAPTGPVDAEAPATEAATTEAPRDSATPDQAAVSEETPKIEVARPQDDGEAIAQAAAEAKAQAIAAKAARKTKRQLWAELTISSITRAFTLVYTLALLTMLTRIQLNLLGRRSYLSSVVTLATPNFSSGISLENNDDIDSSAVYGSDFETNRKYLTFSWWLLNRGWVVVMQRVESAVRQVFGPLSPRDLLSFNQLAEHILAVRKLVEGASPEERRKTNWLSVLLPPREDEDVVIRESGILNTGRDLSDAQVMSCPDSTAPTAPVSLRKLIDETADIIESPSFIHVLTLLLDRGFTALVDRKLAIGAYDLPLPDQVLTDSLEMRELRSTRVVLLPKILSVLTREAHVIGSGISNENEYLQDMEQVSELEAFAAVVYSSNWEADIQGDVGFGASPSVSLGAPTKRGGASQVIKGPGSQTLRVVRDDEDESVVAMGDTGQSMVIVDPAFENVWEKVTSEGQ
ncbi:Peroxisomal biogenesis factor 3 [Ceratocystis lukuohia]|uniref:Peroxisomal biogenesis factor 3 n=1 Tax=Ceratocystis lukuohia TaxID=2019550 RepID=A0ABR4MED8_9PEZI